MTIDDELILELIKPNDLGEVGEDGLIAQIMGTKRLTYEIEETTFHWQEWLDQNGATRKTELIPMTPDMVIKTASTKDNEVKATAIELENDLQWDFGESLRQLRKYKLNFSDTRIIIPKDFQRFAPLYKKAGFRTYLWSAKRKWQCLKCKTETVKEGSSIPKCSNPKCNNHSQNEFRLIGLIDTIIEEF